MSRSFRRLALALALALSLAPLPALALCQGRDMLVQLPADQRAALDTAVASQPFAAGNHWRAERGDSTIHVIGTFHLFDDRMNLHMRKLMPVLHQAKAIYLEATDAEIAQLQAAMAQRPELMFTTTGPTLPERLTEAEWQHLSSEMQARGIPAFLASKFQPWYVSVLLGVPPCAMDRMTPTSSGLDHLILTAAQDMGTPALALEPYDTVFRAFEGMADADEIEMIRATLPLTAMAEDMFATMVESYFREDHRQIWELSRTMSAAKAPDPARAEADFALLEEVLVNARNRAWMEVILPAAKGRTIVVAVGAGHLAGQQGVLNLLAEAGYTLERQPF